MENNNNNNVSQFYVVHFLEEPFKGIDNYVCVPHTWVLMHRFADNIVIVAYPKDEDPSVTRERTKKKEIYKKGWAICTAELKYQSDTYEDAELWISERNNHRPLVQENSNTNGANRMVPWDHDLRSSNQNYSSKSKDKSERTVKPYQIPKKQSPKSMDKESSNEAKKQLYLKRLNWSTTETTKSSAQNADPQPGSATTEQSTIIRDKQLIETAATNDDKSTEGNTHSSKQNNCKNSDQGPSSPLIDVDAHTEVINIEDQSQQEQPRETNGSKNNLASNLTAAPKPPSPVKQTSQPNQHNNQRLRIKDVRTLTTPSNNQEPRVDDISNNRPFNSQHVPSSLSMSAELCNQTENIRRNMATNSQNPLNLIDPTKPLPKPLTRPSLGNIQNPARQGPSILTANNINRAPVAGMSISSQEIQHLPRMNAVPATNPRVVQNVASVMAPQNFPKPYQHPSFVRQDVQQNLPAPQEPKQTNGPDLHQKPTAYRLDPRLCSENRPISEVTQHQPIRPFFNNDLTNVPTQFHQPMEIQHQAQRAVNQRDAQQSLRPILPRNDRRSPTLQGVKKTTPPPAQSRVPNSIHQALLTALENYPLNEQESQAILNRIPQDQRNPDLINLFRNIAVLQKHCPHRSEPTGSSNQSPGIEPPPVHENVHQNQSPQTQKVDQSDRINSTTKRVHFQDDTLRSARKQTRLVDSGCQTNVWMQEPLSPIHVTAPDSGIDTDHEAASGYEMSVDEAHEPENEIDHSEHNSVDVSTAQNSRSKLVLQQQMVEKFATVCIQMGSTLQNAANTFRNLRNSFPETAQSYQTFSGNGRADAPSSSNIIQEVPPAVEERQNLAPERRNPTPERRNSTPERRNSKPERRNSSSKNQQNNDVSEASQRIHQEDSREHLHSTRRFVLPPEYNPNDTKWTLKYQELMPGLVELMPHSNIHVRYGELKRCEQVSNSCQSLARLLLPEVFNEKALGVCASMTETAKVHYKMSPDARPPLDNHGSLVLLNYVIQYGLTAKWRTNVSDVLNALDNEVKKMRFKYGIKSKFL